MASFTAVRKGGCLLDADVLSLNEQRLCSLTGKHVFSYPLSRGTNAHPFHGVLSLGENAGPLGSYWGRITSPQLSIHLGPDGRTEVPADCGSALGCTSAAMGVRSTHPGSMLGGGGRGLTHPCRDTSAQAVNTSIYSTKVHPGPQDL